MSFIFKMLDERDKKIVIDAMEERRFQKGEHVIKEGDDGDELFLVDEGTLNCYKVMPDTKESKYLLTYK